ncbi:lactosylceramide 4-alpha-galactosyltransferase-like [Hibiscus syriacus]|nr:lactosylceramide 4-alpha-galactosyltransferase-like [Hibiscus syriacus]
MTVRNLFRVLFLRVLKSPTVSNISVLLIISVATVFFIVYENMVITHRYMYLEDITAEGKVDRVDSVYKDPLIPPFNGTREERIAWFEKQLPKLELFKSRSSNSKFHDQVSGFRDSNCRVQYFMVWFSPAQSFGVREFSAVDSLFKASPKGCLMILSPSLDSRQGDRILKPLINGGFKVLAVTPDLPFLLKNTPAESWFNELKSGRQDPGSIPLSYNLSNLIRLAMLYKYGGVYLDVDFVILKDFIGLRNAIGAQSISTITKKWTRINGAAMIFDEGHPILYDFLEEFAATYDGSKWGHNGPYLISRVIQRVENKPGYNFTILPPKTFYPMDWIKIARYFKKPCTESEQKWVEYMLIELERSTYAIHIWNHRTKELAIEDGSVVQRLISAHCVICHQRNPY